MGCISPFFVLFFEGDAVAAATVPCINDMGHQFGDSVLLQAGSLVALLTVLV
jgi:hypothetical protein